MSTTPEPSSSVHSIFTSTVATLGSKSSDPFPILDKLWEIFSGKGIRTVFLTIGNSSSVVPDLDIAESMGCPVHVVPLTPGDVSQWSEVSEILKARKREDSAHPFSESIETKWVLPKNIRIQSGIPWWGNGTIDMSGTTISTQKIADLVDSISLGMKLKDSMKRIDILKIDTVASAPGLEIPLLNCIISAGYRPSILLVKWSNMPDMDLSTTIAAGHLQCCGYTLMATIDNKFLYYYNDDNLYEICSWEQRTLMNPIAHEIIRATSRR